MSRVQNRLHVALENLETEDNELVLAGRRVSEIAQEAGSTPFYCYDRDRLTQRVEELRGALPEDISIHYAMKANPMPAIVSHMVTLVDGLDVASGGELRVALDTGIDPELVSFAGPGKRPEEISQAIAAGITLNVESEIELERIIRIADELDLRPSIALRVNPDFELKTSGMKMGGRPAQFGIDAERVPDILRRMNLDEVDFAGFHVYSGSQNLSHEAIVESQSKTLDLCIRLSAAAPCPPRVLNIGGGFGIPYFPAERNLDLGPVGDNLERLLPKARASLGDVEIVIELGRYLVGEAGIYVSRVVDKKESRGETFLVVDGGLHHHLAASGNFGQILRKNYPAVVGTSVTAEEMPVATVVGPLCTPLDLLADAMPLGHAEVGYLIVLFQSGAYGFTASPSRFLSHPESGELLL